MGAGSLARDVLVSILFVLIVGGLIAIGFVVVAYAWMYLFVSRMHYDYVTASSIYFTLAVAAMLISRLHFFFSMENKLAVLVGILVALLMFPLAVSAGLHVYEARNQPVMSGSVNIVGAYRRLIGLPLRLLASGLSHLGPAASGGVSKVQSSPILAQVTAGLATAFVLRTLDLIAKWRRAAAA